MTTTDTACFYCRGAFVIPERMVRVEVGIPLEPFPPIPALVPAHADCAKKAAKP